MDELEQQKAQAMWDSLKRSSRKNQGRLKREKCKKSCLGWIKEHIVELLALAVSIVALVRTF